MKIVFMILHYGDPAVTQRCVESILELDIEGLGMDIVVVDNDPTSRYDEPGTKNVHVAALEESCGFSHANNVGYAWVLEHCGADVVIACNNDLVFCQKDFCRRLERILEKKDSPEIVGPDVMDTETLQHQNPLDTRGRTRKEVKRTIWLNRMGLRFLPILYPAVDAYLHCLEEPKDRSRAMSSEDKKAQDHVILCGACLIFGPKFLQKEVQLFTPETQFYYEEYILAKRCERMGFRMSYRPELEVLHRSGTATHARFQGRKKYLEQKLKRTADACRVYLGVLEDAETSGRRTAD